MDTVLHRDAQQIATALRKGETQHGHSLNVGDDIAAGIARWKHGAGFAGGQGIRWEGHNRTPGPGWVDASYVDLSAFVGGSHKSTQPAGSGIIRMSFERAGLFQNLLRAPVQIAEVDG